MKTIVKYEYLNPKFETNSNVKKLEYQNATLFWKFSSIRILDLFRVSDFVFRILLFLIVPSYANAHLVTTGMGPVYDGIGHLLLTPEDLVAALALALYAGLRGAVTGRRTMFLLPLAWFAGGVAGSVGSSMPLPLAPAVSFLVVGVLVAADFRMPHNSVSVLAIVIGLVHGFLNGAALKEGAGVPGIVGIMLMLFVLVSIISAFVVSLERPWTRIAVRVAGSWVFASGLLMIGWIMKGKGP